MKPLPPSKEAATLHLFVSSRNGNHPARYPDYFKGIHSFAEGLVVFKHCAQTKYNPQASFNTLTHLIHWAKDSTEEIIEVTSTPLQKSENVSHNECGTDTDARIEAVIIAVFYVLKVQWRHARYFKRLKSNF